MNAKVIDLDAYRRKRARVETPVVAQPWVGWPAVPTWAVCIVWVPIWAMPG